jgi:cytoskeletal protein CcmA (bactofilin family)
LSKRDTRASGDEAERAGIGRHDGSYIGPGTTCQGRMKTAHDLYIDGRLEGDAECKTVTVGETGIVTGSIQGDTVYVAGTVMGDTVAQTLRIRASAKVDGDLTVRGNLSIDDGAQVDGTIKMGRTASEAGDRTQAAAPPSDAPANAAKVRAQGR